MVSFLGSASRPRHFEARPARVAAALVVLIALTIPTLSAEAASPALGTPAASKPNVLFIAIDDLNDWVGAFGGNPQAKTPNIDRLAKRGTTFARAYCAAPLCNPSRTALLSGLRTSTTGVYDNNIDWRPLLKDTVTLPKYFMSQGYYVAGAGKIYHGSFPSGNDWNAYFHEKENRKEKRPEGAAGGVGGIDFWPAEGGDEQTVDYETVSYTIEQLKTKRDQPFFLACGLHKPHMPWNVPQKYYDMFPLDQIVLPKVLDTDLDDVPAAGVKIAAPQKDHRAMTESGRWKEAVQAYLAAGAYADAMIGRLLEGLDASGHASDTIVVLWGDHGWHLGEKLHWRKNTLWEEATRAPLIFVVPGLTKAGSVCQRTVDFMSLYPTLADLCGLPIPAHVQGVSIRPLLADANSAWDRPALTTCGRGNHAVRSERWRYIRYRDGSEELYDEEQDPHEWTNVANRPENASVKAKLAQWLPKTDAAEPAATRTAASKKAKREAKEGKAKKDKKDNDD
jgi:arylsulfatase A-like enzyme